jgi:pyoverdine/dityrosine biosynthesis protein Dit1
VFSDLVGVSDPVVTAYTSAIRKMIGDVGGEQLAIYTLADAFDLSDYDSMRRALEQRFALTLAEVRLRVRGDIASRALFNGIHRFLFEDEVTARIGESRNQVRKSCKDLAYRVIRRSDAWSAVVGQMFPGALRLSVHPQSSHSEKLGIHLVPTRDNWLTPWHGVVLDDGASLRLVKRREAEELGARLLWRDGLPSHYVLAGRQ